MPIRRSAQEKKIVTNCAPPCFAQVIDQYQTTVFEWMNAINLDAEGSWILEYLVRIAPTIDPGNLSTLPTYSAVHKILGLQLVGRTWGDSLDRQGMGSLANWAHDNGYPSIT